MNIPFYRYVEYLDDGHYLYQCLQCGEKIDVGNPCFDPRFCWSCGVEYKGAILRKKEDWVYANKKSRGKVLFKIEFANIWPDDRGKPHWITQNDGYRRNDVIEEVGRLRQWQKEDKRDSLRGFDVIYRITVYRESSRRECFDIDTDKYFKRTGKKFNRKDYEKVA